MFKTIILFTFLLFSNHLFAEKVRLTTDSLAYAYRTTTAQEITLDESSGDGTVFDSPHKIYVPIDNGGNNAPDSIFSSVSEIPSANCAAGNVKMSFDFELDGTGRSIFLAAAQTSSSSSSSSDWKVYQIDSISGSATSGTKVVTFSLSDFKDAAGTSTFCAASDFEENRKFYVYASNSGSIGDTVSPDDKSGGIFVDLYISDRSPADEGSTVSVTSITKLDSSFKLNYTGSFNSSSGTIGSVRACISAANPPLTCNATIDNGDEIQDELATDTSCTLDDEIFPAAESGSVTIDGLTNGSEYHAGVILVSKYKFATRIASGECVTPLEIEMVLNENQCYLLTAGFGGNHKVITYFRNFRDRYLLTNYVGQKFVNFYYETAPKYTDYILKSPKVSLVIRTFAWSLYLIFTNIKLVLISFMFVVGFIMFRRMGVSYGRS